MTQEKRKFVVFDCSKKFSNNSVSDRLLDSEGVEDLLSRETECLNVDDILQDDTISHVQDFQLFGNNDIIDASVFESDPQAIFDKIRMYVNKMDHETNGRKNLASFSKTICSTTAAEFNEFDYENWREHIAQFFDFLRAYLCKLNDRKSIGNLDCEKIVKNIFAELKGLLLDMGFLHKIPVPQVRNSTYFHLCLDIRWDSVKLLYLICKFWPDLDRCSFIVQNFSSANDITVTSSSEMTNFLILQFYDMIAAGIIASEENSHSEFSLFCCPCFELFWLLTKRVFDHLSLKDIGVPSFSTLIRQIMEKFLTNSTVTEHSTARNGLFSDKFYIPIIPAISDTHDFCWNLLRNFQLLQKLGPENDFLSKNLDFLLKTTVTAPMLEHRTAISNDLESKIRRNLIGYLRIAWWSRDTSSRDDFDSSSESRDHALNMSTAVLLDLFDVFCRQVEDSFFTGSTLDDFNQNSNCNDISAVACFNAIRSICTTIDFHVLKYKSSFKLFMQILGTYPADQKLIKVLCSRLFSKFHCLRVRELNERGLSNFCDLVLLFAHKNRGSAIREVSDRFFESVSKNLHNNDSTAAKFKILLKSYAVFILIFRQNNEDFSICALKIRQSMTFLAENYTISRNDLNIKRDLFEVIFLTIKIAKEILQENSSDHFSSGEQHLIGLIPESFVSDSIKSDLKFAHARLLFEFCTLIVDRMLFLMEKCENLADFHKKYANLATVTDTIYLKLLPMCKKLISAFVDLFPDQEILIQIWYRCTVFAFFKHSRRFNCGDFIDFLNFPIWHLPNFSGQSVCRYLDQVLNNPIVIRREAVITTEEHDGGWSNKIRAAWFRCLLTITPEKSDSSSSLKPVTEFIVRKNWLKPVEIRFDDEEICNSVQIVEKICIKLSPVSSSVSQLDENWRATIEQCVKFGVEFLKRCQNDLNNDSTSLSSLPTISSYSHTISCLAIIVEHLAAYIHRRDDPRSLLKLIFEQTVLAPAANKSNITCDLFALASKYEAMNNTFVPCVRGIMKICGWLYDGFLKNSIVEAYKLTLDRLCKLSNGRTSFVNFSILLDPLTETFAESIDTTSSPVLVRKICVRKAVGDLLDRQNLNTTSPRGSATSLVTIVLAFYANFSEKTKNVDLLREECNEILPKILHSSVHADDSSFILYVETCASVFDRLISLSLAQGKNDIVEFVSDMIKQFLSISLLKHGEKVVKMLTYLNRDSKFRSSVNVQEIYLLTLQELEEKAGQNYRVPSKFWSVEFHENY